MPKKVFDGFFNNIVRDIKNNYQLGDRYLSVKEMALRYKVSLQTAQRGVDKLEEYGFVSVKRKAGITIIALRSQKKLDNYKIAVISAKADNRFNNAFFKGVQETAATNNISVRFEHLPDMDLHSLSFGEYLLSLGEDGIIALNFNNSALPFYHVMREGLDIVTDIILDELPTLPAVQTDNYHHAMEAGRIFLENDYRRLLVVGYHPQKGNRRYEGMHDVIKDHCDEVQFICLTDLGCMNKIDRFFNNFNSKSAVYSIDYSSNYIVGAKFIQYRISVRNDNFLVYDCEEDCFFYQGLNPVRRVAPSFITLGAELCNVLIVKRETGSYPIPLQRKV